MIKRDHLGVVLFVVGSFIIFMGIMIFGLISLYNERVRRENQNPTVLNNEVIEEIVATSTPLTDAGVTIAGKLLGSGNLIEIKNTNTFTVIVRMIYQGSNSVGEETHLVKILPPNEVYKTKTPSKYNCLYICRESDGALIGFISCY